MKKIKPALKFHFKLKQKIALICLNVVQNYLQLLYAYTHKRKFLNLDSRSPVCLKLKYRKTTNSATRYSLEKILNMLEKQGLFSNQM